MDDNLILALRVIEEINMDSNTFYSAHLFTTENISGFSKKVSFKNKSILTVCSSGDQAFNMILNGASNLSLVDANIFTKYYFYLKEAAIRALDYKGFLSFFIKKNIFDNNVFSFDTYLNIRNYISDGEIRRFWDYLFCHYNGQVIYNSNLFVIGDNSQKTVIERNDYLKNEEAYNVLKKNLLNKSFKFYNINLFDEDIPKEERYDFVYLSNIFDYLNIKDELLYIKKIRDVILKIKNILSDNGEIAVSYLYFYFDDYLNNENGLNSLRIRNELFNELYYVTFPGVSAPFSRQLRNKDALMMYRK